MSKFSFRRSEKNEFKHIAYGLVPAATIAPRPAVPRTPPPRSPCPSPDRDRSALAAAILSSSLTGRTVAIPPTRSFSRSLSESDCSRSENNNIFQPLASTALYTKDRWRESWADRPRLPSPGCSDEEFDEDEEDAGGEGLSEDDHVYQSLDRQERSQSRTLDDIYAKPLKQGFQSERAEETDDSLGIVSPLPCEEIEVQKGALRKTSPKPQRMPSSNRTMPSSDVTEDTSAQSPKDNQGSSTKKSQKKSSASRRDGMRDGMRDGSSGPGEAYREVLDVQREMTRALTEQNQSLAAERRALEQRCAEQSLQLQTSHERLQQLERQLELSRASAHTGPSAGEQAELVSLRQQAQELVDENDSLKMTVHRLTVELSRYQARFRPLGKEESSRVAGLPTKGSAPPWLLDMKYLSPLLLAYEDRLGEKDALLQSVQEDLGKLRQRVEEVVRENERLHDEMSKTGGISHKEWKQLQEQARLVLQENQVLIEQLEVQHTKARDSHNRHHAEVTKVSKQLMLLEVEKQRLEAELEEVRAELRVLQAQHVQARSCLENAVSWEEHCAIATKLKRQLEQEGGRKQSEVEELQERVSSLEAEKRRLVQDKAGLTADIKSMEAERERSRHASRKAQRKIGVLKQHMEASLEKELTAHQYLASIVALAEKTTQERDQLMHMASVLEQDKQGVLATALDGTVRLGKLHERVKVFRKQTAASLGVLGQRLREQEEDFAGKAASYQRQIQHLQTLLRDKQGDLDGALLQKREVEDELEVVWQAATRENQRIREAMLESSPSAGSSSPARGLQGLSVFPSSPGWLSDPQEQGMVELSPPPRPDSSGPPPFASRGSSGGRGTLQRSPMFGSDSDQHQNPSSDESEKNAMDFYS